MALDAKGLEAAAEADARCQRERCKVSACNGFLCHAAITAYLSAVSPPRPVGWMLVPVEPTADMLREGMDDLGWWVEPYEAPRESGVPIECDISAEEAARINSMQVGTVASAYRAMIAASPSKQASASADQGGE